MPPGFTGYLKGISYCPEAAIAAAAANLGRAEQEHPAVRPRARSERRTSLPGPGSSRSTRWARCTWPGPFSGAPLSLAAITPALAGPYDYGDGRGQGRPRRRPDHRPGDRRSPNRCRRSSAASRSGCARSRSTSTGRTSRSTRRTARTFTVDSQGIGDQGTLAAFSSPFHAVNCSALPFKPRMSITQLGGRVRRNGPRTRASGSTCAPAMAMPTSRASP